MRGEEVGSNNNVDNNHEVGNNIDSPTLTPTTLSTAEPVRRYPLRTNRTANYHLMAVIGGTIEHVVAAAAVKVNNMNIKKAILKDRDKALEGIKAELTNMLTQDVFEFILPDSLTPQQSKSIIQSHLFIRSKMDNFKARLVARGDQEQDQLYEDTNSSTISPEAIFIILEVSNCNNLILLTADAPCAYLNADLVNEQLMKLPPDVTRILLDMNPELKAYVDSKGCVIVRLKKALYGLKESAKLWYDHLSNTLINAGYHPTIEDKCLFQNIHTDNTRSYILVHVDDLLMAMVNQSEVIRIRQQLDKTYPGMKYMTGKNLKYLNMEIDVHTSTNRCISVTLLKYTQDLLDDYKITNKQLYPTSRHFLQRNDNDLTNKFESLSLLMKLMYLAKRTRPDILFVCSYMSTFNQNPTINDMQVLTHLLEYLNGTKNYGIRFSSNIIKLYCYADSSYALHEDCKSHTGIIFSIGENSSPIFTMSKKQKLITESSTEAELVALHAGGKIAIWLLRLLSSIGFDVTPVIIFQDNMSTITLATGGKTSINSRHIRIRYFAIKERINEGLLTVVYKPTSLMIADILTKPIAGKLFVALRNFILNIGH